MLKNMKYKSTANGFCRVYYTYQRRLYCLQQTVRAQDYALLACSRDGEPSHVLAHKAYVLEPPRGDTATDCAVRRWLIRRDKTAR
jgi:hypothetical protein